MIRFEAGLAVAAIATGIALAPGVAAAPEEPHRATGEVRMWTDPIGRLVLAVDVDETAGGPDGFAEEAYLLAPEVAGTFRVSPHAVRGTIEWSRADGYVAVSDARGREVWALSTLGRTRSEAWFHGVELVRVAGRFEPAADRFVLPDIPTVLVAGAATEPAPAIATAAAGTCQSGGEGAISCSRRCTNVGGLAGGTSCDVSCGSGYYACCSCEGGLVARCTCKLAPREGESGPKPSDPTDPKVPTPCFPSCTL